MKSVFAYLSFREFLRDGYKARKAVNAAFSYRFIARRLGINASTFVRILQGKRNLTLKMVAPVAEVFKLGKRETAYFGLLVSLEQAGSDQEKKLYFEKAVSFNKSEVITLLADRYALFESWKYIAIRELLSHYRFCGDYGALGRMCAPPITPGEAQRAVALLARLGMIRKDGKGCYLPTDKFVTVGENWRSIAIANYQKSTIALAGEAIERFPSDERDISTCTVSLSQKGLALVKDKVRTLRKEILEVENMDPECDRVFQVNFQIFPLSKSTRGAQR
ncbi:MAG TPA: TIGR02147 family protein [Chitinivibrionales bacterium]|nr:TIGR02147 family protein [Chitinivibrionales bacterium]